MSQQNLTEQPPWMQGRAQQAGKVVTDQPARPRGNPNWHKGMASPNPHGRSAVLGVARTELAKMMQDNVGGIMERQIERALEGDSAAAQLVLSRIIAPLKASGERVQFAFNPEAPITTQIEQVLAAVAAGEVPPDVGTQIISAINTLSQARVTEELADKVAALTAKDVTR